MEVHGNPCAWWNAELSMEFLDCHFANRESDEPVLLLWDDFSDHWTDEVRSYASDLNVYLKKVPDGMTGLCQPADISWNRPFKQRLRSKWLRFPQDHIENHNSNAPFKMAAPERKEVILWVVEAWGALTPRVIASGFNRFAEAETQEPSGNVNDEDNGQVSAVVAQLEAFNVTSLCVRAKKPSRRCAKRKMKTLVSQ